MHGLFHRVDVVLLHLVEDDLRLAFCVRDVCSIIELVHEPFHALVNLIVYLVVHLL